MSWQIEDDKPAQWVIEDAPAAVQAGKSINSIPRQLGLTARYGIEGLANMAQLGTEPIRNALGNLANSVPMKGEGGYQSPLMMDRGAAPNMRPLGEATTSLIDATGAPSPQGADERVIGDATRLLAGSGGAAKFAQLAGGAVPQLARFAGAGKDAVVGGAENVWQFLSQKLPQQFASAAGAGLAGGASREGGGNSLMQGAAAFVGGVAGGVAPGAISSGVNAVKSAANNMRPGAQQILQQRVDQTINVTLQQQGIDPATIDPAMRSALREQVGRAMNMGDINPKAVARLADYTRLNMTPTRSRLTLDPFDVTQEQNASRLAAATGDRAARLPQIAQDNNRRLLNIVDEMGGARPLDPYGQGSAVTGAVRRADAQMEQDVRSAYQAFRDSTGKDLPVPLDPLKQGYQATLKDFGDVIPGAVRKQFENIIDGPRAHAHGGASRPKTIRTMAFDGPAPVERAAPTLSIDEAEKLIKTINRNFNPADPAQARALGELRGHVQNSIIGATETGAGMEAATLGNFARDSARQRFAWQESTPAIARALDGANADTFVAQNILSKAAGYDQVANLARVVNQDPTSREAVRTAIVQQIKSASIGKGATSETGNFSGRGLEGALKDLGDRKLGLFFEPAEIETLKAMARTGSYETFQPRGSAVNNSNTAAGVGSLLQGVSKFVKPVANKLPFGEVAISKPLDYLTASVLTRPAVNIPQSLLMQTPRQPLGQSLLLPAAAYGGLLAAP